MTEPLTEDELATLRGVIAECWRCDRDYESMQRWRAHFTFETSERLMETVTSLFTLWKAENEEQTAVRVRLQIAERALSGAIGLRDALADANDNLQHKVEELERLQPIKDLVHALDEADEIVEQLERRLDDQIAMKNENGAGWEEALDRAREWEVRANENSEIIEKLSGWRDEAVVIMQRWSDASQRSHMTERPTELLRLTRDWLLRQGPASTVAMETVELATGTRNGPVIEIRLPEQWEKWKEQFGHSNLAEQIVFLHGWFGEAADELLARIQREAETR